MHLCFDDILRRLNKTSNTLKDLNKRRIFQYSSVKEAITQCCLDIESDLAQFSVESGVLNMTNWACWLGYYPGA